MHRELVVLVISLSSNSFSLSGSMLEFGAVAAELADGSDWRWHIEH